MTEKSEGFGIHGKQVKMKPRERGETWELWDGVQVTILRRLRGGATEVLLPSGKTTVLYDSEFKTKLEKR